MKMAKELLFAYLLILEMWRSNVARDMEDDVILCFSRSNQACTKKKFNVREDASWTTLLIKFPGCESE